MSELDVPEVDDVTTDVETEDNTTDSSSEVSTQEDITYISFEQAIEWKKKAERLEKAEKTLVDQKRKLKELENRSTATSEDAPMTKFDFELEKFIDKNPEVSEYRDEIAKMAKEKKLTLAQAKILVESDDKTVSNRKKISQSRVSDWESPERNSYTKEQLAKMDRVAYNRAMDRIDSGKATYVK